MNITFYGACKQVTGSCHHVATDTTKALVDCGMIQGEKFSEEQNREAFPFDPASIDYVFITHAHIDHCGRLPKLAKEGFRGKVIATAATLDFVELMLRDSAHVIEMEAELHGKVPLYVEADVEAVVEMFQPVEYGATTLAGDIAATFHDAGHILGSSFIELRYKADGKDQSVVFSGDLGNDPVPLLRPTEQLPAVDVVVMESTYGNRVHESVEERKELLHRAIIDTVNRGGTVLIPAFSLERTQEVLYELNQMSNDGLLPKVPMFLDSPLSISATRLFPVYHHLFDAEASHLLQAGDDLFNFPGLKMTSTTADSKKINKIKGPKVIIAGSGMMQGGRIRHHLKNYLPEETTTVLVIGYQAMRTLGRELLDGAKQVVIDKETVSVKASVMAIGGYSAHADKPHLIEWLAGAVQPPKHVYLVHGEESSMDVLSNEISTQLQIPTEAAEHGQIVEI